MNYQYNDAYIVRGRHLFELIVRSCDKLGRKEIVIIDYRRAIDLNAHFLKYIILKVHNLQ